MGSEKLAQKLNELSFQLFESLAKSKDDNFFISPLSISTALTMTFAGSAANTADQLKAGLCLDGLATEDIYAMNRESLVAWKKPLELT